MCAAKIHFRISSILSQNPIFSIISLQISHSIEWVNLSLEPFFTKSIMNIFKGANHPWVGHVTGHADSNHIRFFKILDICRCYTMFLTSVITIYWWNNNPAGLTRTRSAIVPTMAWGKGGGGGIVLSPFCTLYNNAQCICLSLVFHWRIMFKGEYTDCKGVLVVK